jgi:hypothetical protein
MKEVFIPSFGQTSFREFKTTVTVCMDAHLSLLAITAGEGLSIHHIKTGKS